MRGKLKFTSREHVPLHRNKGNVYGLPPLSVEYGACGIYPYKVDVYLLCSGLTLLVFGSRKSPQMTCPTHWECKFMGNSSSLFVNTFLCMGTNGTYAACHHYQWSIWQLRALVDEDMTSTELAWNTRLSLHLAIPHHLVVCG
jgi:hypothetical protein